MFRLRSKNELLEAIDNLTYKINDEENIRLLKEYALKYALYNTCIESFISDLKHLNEYNNKIDKLNAFVDIRTNALKSHITRMSEIEAELKNRNFNIEEYI